MTEGKKWNSIPLLSGSIRVTRMRIPSLQGSLQSPCKLELVDCKGGSESARHCLLYVVPTDVAFSAISSTTEHDGSTAATHAGPVPDTARDGSEEGGERLPAHNDVAAAGATRRKGNEGDVAGLTRTLHTLTFATVSFDSRHDTARRRSGLRSYALRARVTCPLPPPPRRLLRTPQGSSPRLSHRENRTPRL